MTVRGLEIPPVQNASQILSTWFFISPVIFVYVLVCLLLIAEAAIFTPREKPDKSNLTLKQFINTPIGQIIDTFVFTVPTMPFNPTPIDLMVRGQGIDLLP